MKTHFQNSPQQYYLLIVKLTSFYHPIQMHNKYHHLNYIHTMNAIHLEKIVVIDGRSQGSLVITLQELKTMGKVWLKNNEASYDERIQSIKPHNLATLIYTSGTTGQPKGVELLHDCWVFEAETIDNIGIISPNDKQFLWLPLSHSRKI